MPRYWFFISNRSTRQCIDVVAETADSACGQAGWQLAECVVITVGEMQQANDPDPSRLPSWQRPPLTEPLH